MIRSKMYTKVDSWDGIPQASPPAGTNSIWDLRSDDAASHFIQFMVCGARPSNHPINDITPDVRISAFSCMKMRRFVFFS